MKLSQFFIAIIIVVIGILVPSLSFAQDWQLLPYFVRKGNKSLTW